MKVEIVGSFLPSENLITARKAFENRSIDHATLAKAEDAAVDELVECQLEAGLTEITSGEFRRRCWDKDFYFGLEGIEKEMVDTGRVYQAVEAGTELMRICGRIAYNPQHPFFDDFVYTLRAAASKASVRQTLPSPANLYLEILAMTDGEPERIYPEASRLTADIAGAYNSTLRRLYELGCRSVQFDDTACGLLCDNDYVSRLIQGGIDPEKIHNDLTELLNNSVDGLPADMEVSMYISGGDTVVPPAETSEMPDYIMPKVLSRVKVSKFFLPFRLSDLNHQMHILAHIPSGTKVVLGLVDAHNPFNENADDVLAAIAEAKRHIPAGNLSVSPRTGFKISSYASRGLDYQSQWNKLAWLRNIV